MITFEDEFIGLFKSRLTRRSVVFFGVGLCLVQLALFCTRPTPHGEIKNILVAFGDNPVAVGLLALKYKENPGEVAAQAVLIYGTGVLPFLFMLLTVTATVTLMAPLLVLTNMIVRRIQPRESRVPMHCCIFTAILLLALCVIRIFLNIIFLLDGFLFFIGCLSLHRSHPEIPAAILGFVVGLALSWCLYTPPVAAEVLDLDAVRRTVALLTYTTVSMLVIPVVFIIPGAAFVLRRLSTLPNRTERDLLDEISLLDDVDTHSTAVDAVAHPWPFFSMNSEHEPRNTSNRAVEENDPELAISLTNKKSEASRRAGAAALRRHEKETKPRRAYRANRK